MTQLKQGVEYCRGVKMGCKEFHLTQKRRQNWHKIGLKLLKNERDFLKNRAISRPCINRICMRSRGYCSLWRRRNYLIISRCQGHIFKKSAVKTECKNCVVFPPRSLIINFGLVGPSSNYRKNERIFLNQFYDLGLLTYVYFPVISEGIDVAIQLALNGMKHKDKNAAPDKLYWRKVYSSVECCHDIHVDAFWQSKVLHSFLFSIFARGILETD